MGCSEEAVVGKLVRDRIPEIIRADGREPRVRVLDEEEYLGTLLEKLCKESAELRDAAPGQRLEEAADVYEVLTAALEATGTTREHVQIAAKRERDQRGGFQARIYLESLP